MVAETAPNESIASHFPYVCTNCKIRKKACDKRLPSCTYCTRRAFVCHYSHISLSANHGGQQKYPNSTDPRSVDEIPQDQRNVDDLTPSMKSDLMLLHSVSDHAHLLPVSDLYNHDDATYAGIIHRRVSRLLQTTGLSLTDIYERYHDGLYNSLPVINRTQLICYQDATVSSVPPSADLSLLVLATTLLVMDDSKDARATQLADRTSFYLSTKMLYAQAQALLPASLPLVQTGIQISMYEYSTGRCQTASVSIAACGMLYRACRTEYESISDTKDVWHAIRLSVLIGWCILVFERIVACEVQCRRQLFILQFPNTSTELPNKTDVGDLNNPNSCASIRPPLLGDITTSGCGFPRTIQAAWLLDRVLSFIELPPPIHLHWSTATALDQDLQSFLKTTLELELSRGNCCAAIATTVRAMFLFHERIVRMTHNLAGLEDWRANSQAALNTAAKLMAEVALGHKDGHMMADINTAPLVTRNSAYGVLKYLKNNSNNIGNLPLWNAGELDIEALENLISCIDKRWRSDSL